uniref:RxLR effector protein n=1 Tax=Phytophthora agathidicida TaxID=1642459 RepID=A0A7G4WI40_9STRA|nr:PaRXLR51 [Phytophthora agathidicida]
MRLSCVLLVVAAALFASGNALSAEVDAEKRSLRSHQAAGVGGQDEERGLNFSFLDQLPEQFKRMKTEPSFMKQTFVNWSSDYHTVDDAVQYMKDQGLKESTIKYFKEAYIAFLRNK